MFKKLILVERILLCSTSAIKQVSKKWIGRREPSINESVAQRYSGNAFPRLGNIAKFLVFEHRKVQATSTQRISRTEVTQICGLDKTQTQ
jgi:hypothetical protein